MCARAFPDHSPGRTMETTPLSQPQPAGFRTRAGKSFAVALLAPAGVCEREQRPAGGSGGTAQLSGSGGVELEECCWLDSEAAPRQGARARG